jgi:hypothetical protein
MRMADARRWCLGALLGAAGVTAVEAGPILLPNGDPNVGISDDTKLSILFHHRYHDITIPEAWSRRVVLPAPARIVSPPGLSVARGRDAASAPTAAVPEPSTLILLGLGAVGAALARRKPADNG